MYVTDTHALIYYSAGKFSRLGKAARRIFEAADAGSTTIHVPTVVLWEITDRLEDGVLKLPMSFEQWCRELDKTEGFSILPLEWQDFNEARNLRFNDPFDCLIAGAALRLGMPLITRDAQIQDSGLVKTVW